MRCLPLLLPLLLVFEMCPGVSGQEVVSARSGMVHFTEGRVFLDDHQLDRKSGSFPGIKEGSTLRTEKGRAEVLLTPGAFLRLDENSSIRMVSTELADTRLMFLSGSAILDLSEGRANNAITITYKDSRTRFPKKGVYRLDADTGVLQAYSGEAAVDYAGKQTRVDPSHLFFCWLGLETDKLGDGTEDEFYDWASDRSQVIGEENQLAQETGRDPGDADGDPNSQLGMGTVPYLGSPGMVPPASIGPQIYRAPYNTYSMGSTLYNPFLNFAPTPYVPFGYPVLVLRQRYRAAHPEWQRRGDRPLWHPVSAGALPRPPRLPTRIVVPGAVGTFQPGSPRMGAAALGAYHPTAPRVGVGAGPIRTGPTPVGARPMGRR
jgi:hypothetical protein